MQSLTDLLRDRSLTVDLLVLLFGVSSWVAINGVWVETPLLVQRLPEAWNLASYIVVITQLANIGPISYSLLKQRFSLQRVEKWSIHVTMAVGCVSSLLLAFYWDTRTLISGKSHSVVFLALMGCLALVDCTTSVLYLPFMAHFKNKYLMTYLIGEGFSGLLPSFASLAQGIGGNPSCVNGTTGGGNETAPLSKAVYPEARFSVEAFFIFLFLMMIISWVSFFLLNILDVTKKERAVIERPLGLPRSVENNASHEEAKSSTHLLPYETLSHKSFVTLLAVQAYVCCLSNGALTAIQTYSTLPYGNTSYHLATNLAVISGPVASFTAFAIHKNSFRKPIPGLALLGSLCAGYIVAAAVLSPSPPLKNSPFGSVVIIVAWVIFHGSFSYVKACIAATFRNAAPVGHEALFYCGVFTQVGSAVGAVVMFFVVNYTHIFNSYDPCNQ